MSKQDARLHSTLVLMGLLAACGGRSELDDYANGIPGIVPLVSHDDQSGSGNNGSSEDGGTGDTHGGNAGGDGGSAHAGSDAGSGNHSGGGALGAACDDTHPCAGDKSYCLQSVPVFGGIVTITYPGGYCVVPKCQSDNDCPTGSACFTGGSTPACLLVCKQSSDCRTAEGYTCGTVPLPGTTDQHTYCLPPTTGLGGLGGLGGAGN